MNEVPEGVVNLDLHVPKYASTTGKRFYFIPNLMSRMTNGLPSVEDRKTNFLRKYDLTYIDSIEYNFPSDFQMEYLPEPVEFESEFGKYQMKLEFIQGKLHYTRKLEFYSGEFEPEKYEEFRSFIDKIEAQDKTKVVLTTKT